MSISLKDAGVWKDGAPWVKDGGVWKPADKAWVKDAGIWKEIYSGRLPPFNLSGTFATNLDGWTGTASRYTSPVRTAPGMVEFSMAKYIEYVVPKTICGGLTISASIWHRTDGDSKNRTLSYKIGSGSFVTIATATDSSTTYAQMSGSFDNPGDDDVTIRFSFVTNTVRPGAADDWAISGV